MVRRARSGFWWPGIALVVLVSLVGFAHPVTGQSTGTVQDTLPYMSGVPQLLAAQSFGVTTLAGKNVTVAEKPASVLGDSRDTRIGVTIKHENEPSVDSNPTNRSLLVAANHVIPVGGLVRCGVYRSTDGGSSRFVFVSYLPQLASSHHCSDPVVRYGGTRVYAVYMNIPTPVTGGGWDIVVSFSDDDGLTWTGPFVALDAPAFANNVAVDFAYDKPWVSAENGTVDVTATKFGPRNSCTITYTRSIDGGVTFAPPTFLERSLPCGEGTNPVVQGSHPVRMGSTVFVAWYNSSTDGWLTGTFRIRRKVSTNGGVSFGPAVNAATDSSEVPFWLGPGAAYHRWWGTMFPVPRFASNGSVHIVYAHDPVAGSATPEDGNIRYVSSAASPYTVWSAPATVNDDGTDRAQGYPALVPDGTSLHATWEDHRNSATDNLYYDTFYSTKNGGVWSANIMINDVTSISDFIFIGDYTDITLTNAAADAFAIWTDRQHQTSIFQFEDNTLGSRIP